MIWGMMARLKTFGQKISMRYIIWCALTVSAAIMTAFTASFLYQRFSKEFKETADSKNQALMIQVNNTLQTYLRNLMQVSDTLAYSVIKNKDIKEESITEEMQLLYDTNKNLIENIALFSQDGELLASAPALPLRMADIMGEEWFREALARTENMHFSMPQVQKLFINNDDEYTWVLDLSRAVQMNYGKESTQGVLLIQMRYSELEQIFGDVSLGRDGYTYLADANGTLIYHPFYELVCSQMVAENNMQAARYRDGPHTEMFGGRKRNVTVKSVGYTGWKIVGVTYGQDRLLRDKKGTCFLLFIILFALTCMMGLNSFISSKVTNPIRKLEHSVRILEEGALDTMIEPEGSYEVRHLGNAIRKMAVQLQRLMQDIVKEHESKRKNELYTLQSQINPHFLYNTLDVIVWMIENEKRQDAVRAVTALARFFRISLSKGKTGIRVEDELEHVRNYLMIQSMRYKNKFTYIIEAEEDTLELGTLKLVLQPLVENAIYHGMEFMDGDGHIQVSVTRRERDLYMEVADNGLGMREDTVEHLMKGLLTGTSGSGIGIKNVQERIRLYFGPAYGLVIHSEPDVGTSVVVHLPAISYEEMRKKDL